MDFLRFLWRFPLASIGFAVALLLGAYGIVNDAWGLYQTGLPDWVWQLLALFVFALSFARWLYSWDRERAVAMVTRDLPKEDPPRRDPARDANRERQRVIGSLEYAQRCAAIAVADTKASNRQRTAEREMPGMRAALLSANKLCGIPIPREYEDKMLELEVQRRLIEKVLPFLKENHLEEAKAEGERFLAKVTTAEKKADEA